MNLSGSIYRYCHGYLTILDTLEFQLLQQISGSSVKRAGTRREAYPNVTSTILCTCITFLASFQQEERTDCSALNRAATNGSS